MNRVSIVLRTLSCDGPDCADCADDRAVLRWKRRTHRCSAMPDQWRPLVRYAIRHFHRSSDRGFCRVCHRHGQSRPRVCAGHCARTAHCAVRARGGIAVVAVPAATASVAGPAARRRPQRGVWNKSPTSGSRCSTGERRVSARSRKLRCISSTWKSTPTATTCWTSKTWSAARSPSRTPTRSMMPCRNWWP